MKQYIYKYIYIYRFVTLVELYYYVHPFCYLSLLSLILAFLCIWCCK